MRSVVAVARVGGQQLHVCKGRHMRYYFVRLAIFIAFGLFGEAGGVNAKRYPCPRQNSFVFELILLAVPFVY